MTNDELKKAFDENTKKIIKNIDKNNTDYRQAIHKLCSISMCFDDDTIIDLSIEIAENRDNKKLVKEKLNDLTTYIETHYKNS
ncbi:MAG: hypothetical protein PWP46_8 [Fusobacteriaceae bacterium]|jgi:hypothetical protein|nr:hypothetical protein [Fusobacteriales bacterium]MDN5303129.1 hypothetical protein [Fusobacteriaceae bacterium]